jgi:NADP-dependent aldehyde dehydrogenase
MDLHGRNLVGGEPAAEGEATFRALDPARGRDIEPVFHEATTAEADRALELAAAAFEEYRERSSRERADFLDRAAQEILDLGDALIARARAETALPEPRLIGERARTVNQIRMFASLIREGSWVEARIDRADPARKPLPRPDVRRMLVPIGPVVVFGASNFPLAFSAAGGDAASALAAGNPIIVKAHPAHPGTSEMAATALCRAAAASGMPRGVVSMLQGIHHEIGLHLVKHPATRAVGFTGSLRAGRALFDAAQSRPEPIPVYAEMGSINPVFLLPGALEERADAIAEGLHQSVTLGVGQFCTNPGLVVAIEGPALDRLLARLSSLIESTPCGTMLGTGIKRSYEEGLDRMSKARGVVRRATAAARPDAALTQAAASLLVTDAESFIRQHALSDEVFGPSTLVVRCGSLDDLEKVARAVPGQLTMTVHAGTGDGPVVLRLLPYLRARAGRLIFNGYPTGVEVCPSMHHGGPYPATTDSRCTSVGTAAILRFARPVCYQDFPQEALPPELRDRNELGIWRLEGGQLTRGDCT